MIDGEKGYSPRSSIYPYPLVESRSPEVRNPIALMEKNPGFPVFKKNYEQAIGLRANSQEHGGRDIDWYQFVMHDLKNIPTLAITPFTVNKTEKNKQLADLMTPFVNTQAERNILKQLDIVGKMAQIQPDDTGGVFPKKDEGDYFRRNRVFRKLYPLLNASAQFLMSPHDDHFKDMRDREVAAYDILQYEFPKLAKKMGDKSLKLDGFESVILFNFLKNAKEHGVEKGNNTSHIKFTSDDDDSFSVENYSNSDLPEESLRFGLGVRGEHGGTGIGMFTAARLYAPLIGKEVTAASEKIKEGDPDAKDVKDLPVYRIIFSLRKSPTANTVSPLPPPSQ